MAIGAPTEVKTHGYRLGSRRPGRAIVQPAPVVVERGAGAASVIANGNTGQSGAWAVRDADDVCGRAHFNVEAKEPHPEKVRGLASGHVLFSSFHLARCPDLAHALADSGAACVAYETVKDDGARDGPMADLSLRVRPRAWVGRVACEPVGEALGAELSPPNEARGDPVA
jgi:alanine dehydrogenase